MFSNRSLRHALVTLSLVATSCGGTATDVSSSGQGLHSANPKPAPSDALHATDIYTTGPAAWKTAFNIGSTYNVYFAVDLPAALSGIHQVTVFIYGPDHSLFQRNTVSFAAGTTAGVGQQQAQKTSSGYRVWTSMPVAGTAIDQYGMTGTWSSQAYVDAASTANAKASFLLE